MPQFPARLAICLMLIISACQTGHEKHERTSKAAENQAALNAGLLNAWKNKASFSTFLHPSGNLGFWGQDYEGLPVFEYTGHLPAITYDSKGGIIGYPDDPVFLIGNNRLTLFTHASGQYELMTLERSIARLNCGKTPDSGENFATLRLGDSHYELTGQIEGPALSSQTEKAFGCGFAAYAYQTAKDIKVKRILSTLPSMRPADGCPAFMITAEISNGSSNPVEFSYSEGLTARYDFTFQHNDEDFNIRMSYPVRTSISQKGHLVTAEPEVANRYRLEG